MCDTDQNTNTSNKSCASDQVHLGINGNIFLSDKEDPRKKGKVNIWDRRSTSYHRPRIYKL